MFSVNCHQAPLQIHFGSISHSLERGIFLLKLLTFPFLSKYQIPSLKESKTLAQIQAKELPKEGNLFGILKKATRLTIGAKIDLRQVGKR